METRGGVYDLSRVVGVLALLELTPGFLDVRREAPGLRIDMQIETDPRTRDLCVNRLAALVSVIGLRVTESREGVSRWSDFFRAH